MGKLGDEIKRIRVELGLSQKALAERVGIAQPSLWRIEAAGGGIDGVTLYRLCDALGVPCDHFRELVLANVPPISSGLLATVISGAEGPADAKRPGPPPDPAPGYTGGIVPRAEPPEPAAPPKPRPAKRK